MNHQSQHTQSADIDTQMITLEPVTLVPVGIVKSPIKEPMLRADSEGLSQVEHHAKATEYHRKRKTTTSEIWLQSELEGILDGIEDFSHIMVLYWPHLVEEERRSLLKVHPIGRKDIPRQGIYATCSPARPNPILLTAVQLLKRKGNMLRVLGLEAVDGSPVLDIKPYNPGYYRIDDPSVPEWMEKIQREMKEK